MDQKLVFISSTQVDLVQYRAIVAHVILGLGMKPVWMEEFPSTAATPIEVCRKKVQDCHLFIGIYAHRYGFIPKDEFVPDGEKGKNRSISEMEYDWAKEAGIPTRIFVVNESYGWPDEWRDQGEEAEALKKFKARVQEETTWKKFTTPESLASEVGLSLRHDLYQISRDERQQKFFLRGGLIVVAILLLAIVLAIILTRPDEAAQADRQATLAALAVFNQTATATHWTATPTITPTFTPTYTPSHTPTPTATPLEGSPAALGTVAAILALDDGGGSLSGLGDELEQALAQADNPIPVIRISHPLQGREQAREVSEIYNATFALWGTMEDENIILHFEITPHRKPDFYPQAFLILTWQMMPYFEMHIPDGGDHSSLVLFIEALRSLFDNDYLTAFRILEPLAEQLPEAESLDTQTAVYFHYGLACYYVNRYKCGLDAYSRVIELNPDTASFYLNRSLVYRIGQVYPPSIEDLTQAIKLDPTFAVAYMVRSASYLAMGQYTEAKIDVDRAIQLAPDIARAYYARGEIYLGQQLYEAAWEDFNHAIELDPEFAEAYERRGSATMGPFWGNFEDPGYDEAMRQLDADQLQSETILKSYKFRE
jgi:tetratricopeptide (TPR) repeat protein